MHPPHIEFQSPFVEIKVALSNIGANGDFLESPLPLESTLRAAMMEFVGKVHELNGAD